MVWVDRSSYLNLSFRRSAALTTRVWRYFLLRKIYIDVSFDIDYIMAVDYYSTFICAMVVCAKIVSSIRIALGNFFMN